MALNYKFNDRNLFIFLNKALAVINMGLLGALIPKSVQIAFVNKIIGFINTNNKEQLKEFEGKCVLFDVTGLNKFYVGVKQQAMTLRDMVPPDASIIGSLSTLSGLSDGTISLDTALGNGSLKLTGSKELITQLKVIFNQFVKK
jgi:hypothetical protein